MTEFSSFLLGMKLGSTKTKSRKRRTSCAKTYMGLSMPYKMVSEVNDQCASKDRTRHKTTFPNLFGGV